MGRSEVDRLLRWLSRLSVAAALAVALTSIREAEQPAPVVPREVDPTALLLALAFLSSCEAAFRMVSHVSGNGFIAGVTEDDAEGVKTDFPYSKGGTVACMLDTTEFRSSAIVDSRDSGPPTVAMAAESLDRCGD